MRLRHLLLTPIVLGLVAPVAVEAAPRPPVRKVCNLLVDPAGDGASDLFPLVAPDALDILGGDIATGAKTVVAVLRLKSTNTANDNYAWLGYEWDFNATVSGIDYRFTNRRTGPTGPDTPGVAIGDLRPKFTFKVEGNTFKWTIARADAGKQLAKPKQVFTLFRANSKMFGASADTAPANENKYLDRTPSCIAAP